MVALFILKLVAGITLMWLLMPRKEVTDGFFRIQMLVVLGLCSLAVLTLESDSLTGGRTTPSPEEVRSAQSTTAIMKGLMVAGAITAYAGHIVWKLGRRTPGRIAIFLLAFICIGCLLLHSAMRLAKGPGWLQMVSDLSSASVLGAMLTGMLLGHWYLTTPAMSIQPLTWFGRILLLSSAGRLIASSLALTQFGWSASDTTHQLWMCMRLAGGILVPGIASLMVVRILSYRNTQSATGVLFAGLILVFMGEMTAALLERDLGIPY